MILRLNLGCGQQYLKDFVNIDIREDVDADLRCDVSKLNYFADNSVDLIYASDIVEHFGWRETEGLLQEWYRVLKVGGQIYVRTPDLERWAKALLSQARPEEEVIMNIFGGQEYLENTHKSIFTKSLLKKKLEEAGFHDIVIGDTDQPLGINMEVTAQK